MKTLILLIATMLPFSVVAVDKNDLTCMTTNAYHEARGEGKMGLLMVMDTVMERKKSKNFPNTVCKVVYQKRQFSWTLNPTKIDNFALYKKIEKLAVQVLDGKWSGISKGSLFYHSDYVTPNWAKEFTITKTIDNHIFYKY